MILKIATKLGNLTPPPQDCTGADTPALGCASGSSYVKTQSTSSIPGYTFIFPNLATNVAMESSCSFSVNYLSDDWDQLELIQSNPTYSEILCNDPINDGAHLPAWENIRLSDFKSIRDFLYQINNKDIDLNNITSTWNSTDSRCDVSMLGKDCCLANLSKFVDQNNMYLSKTIDTGGHNDISCGVYIVTSITKSTNTFSKAYVNCPTPVQFDLNSSQLSADILENSPKCYTNPNQGFWEGNSLVLTEKSGIPYGTEIAFGGNAGDSTCNESISWDATNNGTFAYTPQCFQDSSSNLCLRWNTLGIDI